MSYSIPSRIGSYEIQGELGRGGMGVVYKGFDPDVQRPVAIKTVRTELFADDEAAVRERFKREAQAAGALLHPNIVTIFRYGEEAGLAYIVMEFVQGRTLREYLRQIKLAEFGVVAHIMRGLLDGLGYAHENGVVHRDIKPANILLNDRGMVKITDFGIARLGESSLTQIGASIGSLGYMSPEQAMGAAADHRSDIFSAGAVLYEMLTGTKAFSSDIGAQFKLLNEDPPPPSRVNPSLPLALDAVVLKALHKTPDLRFQNVAEFAAALERVWKVSGLRNDAAGSDAATVITATATATVRTEPMGAPPATAANPDPASSASGLALPAEVLVELERCLARHVGPLARVVVARSRRSARTPGQLCRLLAEQIDDSTQRAQFLAAAFKVLRDLGVEYTVTPSSREPGATAPTAPTRVSPSQADSTTGGHLTPELLAKVEQRLARHVGPLSKVLVRNAAKDTGSFRDLCLRLSQEIENEAERKAFLTLLDQL